MKNVIITVLVLIFCLACRQITAELAAQPFEKKSEPLTYSAKVHGENIYLNTDSVHWKLSESGKRVLLSVSIQGESNCDSIFVLTTQSSNRKKTHQIQQRKQLFNEHIEILEYNKKQSPESPLVLYLYHQDKLFDTITIAPPTP